MEYFHICIYIGREGEKCSPTDLGGAQNIITGTKRQLVRFKSVRQQGVEKSCYIVQEGHTECKRLFLIKMELISNIKCLQSPQQSPSRYSCIFQLYYYTSRDNSANFICRSSICSKGSSMHSFFSSIKLVQHTNIHFIFQCRLFSVMSFYIPYICCFLGCVPIKSIKTQITNFRCTCFVISSRQMQKYIFILPVIL